MTNDKINDVKRVAGACAYEPDSIQFDVNGSSAGGVTPQCWTSTWHRALPGSSNNVTREYSWGLNMGGGIGGLLNVKQSGQNYSYLYDGKGNVNAVIDSAEAVAATYTYDAFGNIMVKTGSLDQPFQFSTKRYDSQTGLVYYGYRFYSPVQGRWINRDPLGEAGGVNLYGFVGNSPINFIDSFGLHPAGNGVGPHCHIGDEQIWKNIDELNDPNARDDLSELLMNGQIIQVDIPDLPFDYVLGGFFIPIPVELPHIFLNENLMNDPILGPRTIAHEYKHYDQWQKDPVSLYLLNFDRENQAKAYENEATLAQPTNKK